MTDPTIAVEMIIVTGGIYHGYNKKAKELFYSLGLNEQNKGRGASQTLLRLSQTKQKQG